MIRKLWHDKAVRNIVYIVCFFGVWQFVAMLGIYSPLLFPSLGSIVSALAAELGGGQMLGRIGYSLRLIGMGIAVSIALAAALVVASTITEAVRDLLESIIALVDPLPGIALLPLAILWFGVGESAVLFIMIHSVLWPVLLNIGTGFRAIPKIYLDIGRNIGLGRFALIFSVYFPASLPNILIGLRTGWARAWRAFISAEMVFGASGTSGGLGWDIYMKRSFMDIPGLYATLLVIMLTGIFVEVLLFRLVENRTVKKWGMLR